MTTTTKLITVLGVNDTLNNNDGSTLNNINTAAQIAAMTAGTLAGVNPLAGAAAVTAGMFALGTGFTALVHDVSDGNNANWDLKSIGTVAADTATVLGDIAIIVGGVASQVPGGQGVAAAAEAIG